jgi:hypothetical protein
LILIATFGLLSACKRRLLASTPGPRFGGLFVAYVTYQLPFSTQGIDLLSLSYDCKSEDWLKCLLFHSCHGTGDRLSEHSCTELTPCPARPCSALTCSSDHAQTCPFSGGSNRGERHYRRYRSEAILYLGRKGMLFSPNWVRKGGGESPMMSGARQR